MSRPNTVYTARYMGKSFLLDHAGPEPYGDGSGHRHPGPEAWYVVSGAQCLETPNGLIVASAGGGAMYREGWPMAISSVGAQTRRPHVLIFHRSDQPFSMAVDDHRSHGAPHSDWKPQGLSAPSGNGSVCKLDSVRRLPDTPLKTACESYRRQRPKTGPITARYRRTMSAAAALAIALATPLAQGPTAGKPRIAVFSGPNATIQNNKPLVTSNKAREQYGLPMRIRSVGPASGRLASLSASRGTSHRVHRDVHGASARV